MVEYPNFVGPGKNPLLPDFSMAVTPLHTETLLNTLIEYNNAIETNYIALEAALIAIVAILGTSIGTVALTGNNTGKFGSKPLTEAEIAALTLAVTAVGVGIEDPDLSPGGVLRPALSGAKLTTQTMIDLTTGPFSLLTFESNL